MNKLVIVLIVLGGVGVTVFWVDLFLSLGLAEGDDVGLKGDVFDYIDDMDDTELLASIEGARVRDNVFKEETDFRQVFESEKGAAKLEIGNVDPVYKYNFDDGAIDLVSGVQGIVHGPQLLPARRGNAYLFSGNDDYIELPASKFNKEAGTVSVWFFLNRFGKESSHIFCYMSKVPDEEREGAFHFERIVIRAKNEELSVLMGRNFNYLSNVQKLEIGQWYHVVLAWGREYCVVYVNGKERGRAVFTALRFAGRLILGNVIQVEGKRRPVLGFIDDLTIWNRRLSMNEINEVFASDRSQTFNDIAD